MKKPPAWLPALSLIPVQNQGLPSLRRAQPTLPAALQPLESPEARQRRHTPCFLSTRRGSTRSALLDFLEEEIHEKDVVLGMSAVALAGVGCLRRRRRGQHALPQRLTRRRSRSSMRMRTDASPRSKRRTTRRWRPASRRPMRTRTAISRRQSSRSSARASDRSSPAAEPAQPRSQTSEPSLPTPSDRRTQSAPRSSAGVAPADDDRCDRSKAGSVR